jgi:hypothetical protein
MTEGPYTTVARSLLTVAENLTKTFADRPVGAGNRLLEVRDPLGPSTEAGKRSRQVLTLTAGGSSVAIGWLDIVNAECALKEYPMLKLAHELRGAGALDFTDDDDARFTSLLTADLASMGVRLRVDVVDTSELRTEKTLVPAGKGKQRDPVLLAVVGFLVVLVVLALVLSMR